MRRMIRGWAGRVGRKGQKVALCLVLLVGGQVQQRHPVRRWESRSKIVQSMLGLMLVLVQIQSIRAVEMLRSSMPAQCIAVAEERMAAVGHTLHSPAAVR